LIGVFYVFRFVLPAPFVVRTKSKTDNANVLLRAEVLNRINSRKKPAVIVSYPEALFEK
jgi:hypothetical protein